MLANTPQPPYYAVIFSSYQTDDISGYSEMSDKMMELAKQQKGKSQWYESFKTRICKVESDYGFEK